MRGLLYLYQRTISNRIRRALKKPKTYIAGVFVLLYVAMIVWSIYMSVVSGHFNTPENMVTILTGLIFLVLPSNVISYSKRRGLLFRQSEVHFVFPAPVSPKMVLMFTGVKSFAMNILLGFAVIPIGIICFRASVMQVLVYFLFFAVFESILEASIIIFCYGNERLSERFFKGLTIVMYGLMAVIVGIAAYLLFTKDASFQLIQEFLSFPAIQMIPIVGWNVAVIRLIFIGPELINVIGTVLYLVSTIAMFLVAWRMKCTGAYYEDAMKFADDYQKIRENKKKGVVSAGFGKKKKFKEAKVEYKGAYGKAIYFRQLLEYRKSPTFIFGWNTLLCLGLGIGIAIYGYVNNPAKAFGSAKIFVIPAVVAYVVFIFSGYATKWSKELENPYTYLIPDTPLKKVWYATKIEHIRALIDGILVTVPGAIVFKIGPVMTILTVLLYICLMANRLYYNMLADALIGKTLGTTGRSIVKTMFQGIVILFGIIAAVAGGMFLGVEAGFFFMILVTGILTFAGAAGASISFYRMEVLE